MIKTLPYKRLLLTVRWLAIALVIIVVFFLVKRDLVLSGQLFLSHDYLSPSPFFTDLVPKQRIATSKSGVTFLQEPVYTTFRYPRPFQQAQVAVEFRNPNNLFAEFGPQVDLPEIYDRYGLNHPEINQLLSNEDWLQAGSHLYQKKSSDYHYTDIDQFWAGLPEQQNTGYYGVDWQEPFLPEFTKDEETTTLIETPLIGRHNFLAASNQDQLALSFTVQDLNNLAGTDAVTVVVETWDGEVLAEKRLADDGVQSENGAVSTTSFVDVKVPLSDPSIVRIRFQASDDILIHSIELNSDYFVAEERVHLAGGPDYISEFGDDRISTVEVTTSARAWNMQTLHRSTLQTVRLTKERVELTEPYKMYSYAVPKSDRFLLKNGYPIFVEKGNLVMQGKGVFALTSESYFSPYPWLVDSTLNPEKIGLSYLVTDYIQPIESDEGGFTQVYSIDLSQVFAPNKAVRFQWALPGMDEEKGFQLVSVSSDYTSEAVTFSNAKDKIIRFIKREFSYE
jgi:hypothetical protein